MCGGRLTPELLIFQISRCGDIYDGFAFQLRLQLLQEVLLFCLAAL